MGAAAQALQLRSINSTGMAPGMAQVVVFLLVGELFSVIKGLFGSHSKTVGFRSCSLHVPVDAMLCLDAIDIVEGGLLAGNRFGSLIFLITEGISSAENFNLEGIAATRLTISFRQENDGTRKGELLSCRRRVRLYRFDFRDAQNCSHLLVTRCVT